MFDVLADCPFGCFISELFETSIWMARERDKVTEEFENKRERWFQDQRNFLKSPPKEVDFPWNFEAVQPMAQATLALDPNLENMRFQLVPKV